MTTLAPPLSGLRAIADRYEAFIVDLWGVLHDGVTAFPAAVAALESLKAAGKTVIILSNAPRRAASVAARNAALGIDPRLSDLVMSSGEATWQHLNRRSDPWYAALGSRCLHLGPARDMGIREGLPLDFVAAPGGADFLLITGLLDNQDTLDTYESLLREALARRLPLVCANPDLEVIRGGQRELCAGAIAQHYEGLGGETRWNGKPDPAIYHHCLAALGLSAGPQILAIGDSLRTDIAGASAAGLSTLFIAGGIHAEALGLGDDERYDTGELQRLCAERNLSPDAAMARLAW